MQQWGLTGVHDAGASPRRSTSTRRWRRRNELNFRLYVMISDDSAAIEHYFARGPRVGAATTDTLWVRSDQALRRRRARLARRGAARAVQRRSEQQRPARLRAGAHRGGGRARAQGRLPGEHARHRRSRQPHGARRLRAGAQGRPDGGPPLPRRARADPQPRRHPALRGARRHSIHAGEPPDERHVLGRHAAGLDALVRRLCVALAARQRRRSSRTAATSRWSR